MLEKQKVVGWVLKYKRAAFMLQDDLFICSAIKILHWSHHVARGILRFFMM